MAVLPLLADPDRYEADSIDLMADAARRAYWIDVFANHLPSLIEHAIESDERAPDVEARAARAGARFAEMLDEYRVDPSAHGRICVMRMCELREQCLRDEGFTDAYREVKAREDDTALQLLGDVLVELDALEDSARLQMLITGIFAGNIFDLGARDTIDLFQDGGIDFKGTRDGIARPWHVDDFDALAARWRGTPHRRAVLLVDNAGADVVLGMIPLARELARRGTHVVLSANTLPALNDITHDELGPLMQQVAAIDPVTRQAMDDGRISLIASGNAQPLIDFKHISCEFAEASADADLLVIEGMGRALETNYWAQFTCDTLKLAMIKERDVAEMLGMGGKTYDVVCRFEPSGVS